MDAASLTRYIKELAYGEGFAYAGVARAGYLEEAAPRLERWLAQGRHGQMGWMEGHFDKRLDPRRLVEGTRSVVSLLFNYYPRERITTPEGGKVSCYAYGQDYHDVIRPRLNRMLEHLSERFGITGRGFTDSAPVMEREWALRSGLGWIGKNTLLIRPGAGSFFFLAELMLDCDLIPDGPMGDFCGTCTRCIDACPTGALDTPYQLDATRCISYLTIELRDQIPEAFAGQMAGWVYGCDICQDICPWNRFSAPTMEPSFSTNPVLTTHTLADWQAAGEEGFRKLLACSAIRRTKYRGWMRNLTFVYEGLSPPSPGGGTPDH